MYLQWILGAPIIDALKPGGFLFWISMRGEATVRFEMGTVFVSRTDFDSLVAMHIPFQKKSNSESGKRSGTGSLYFRQD